MRLIFIIAFTATYVNAVAQQAEQLLDPVTIAASLKPVSVSRSGRNITSIPGDYFNRLPVQSLDELLRFIPGVEVQMRGPAGAQSDIVLRGGTFQQVLIILDGLRLNDPNTGHFNSYIPIAAAEIEKIEILKGAASAIYGSEAVGGVVLITTKTFAAKAGQSKKQVTVQGTAGQFDQWGLQAGGFYQHKNTAVAAGLFGNNSNGQLQRGTRGYFNNHTVSLSALQQFGKHWQLALRLAYDSRDFAAQNFYTTFKSDTAKEKVQSTWNHLHLVYQKTKGKFIFDAGYKKAKDEFAFNPASTANKNISSLLQLSARYEIEVSASTGLVSGLQFQHKQISSNDRGNHQLNQFAGFLILNQYIGKQFFLSPAVRIDYTESSGTELVPQINLSYKMKRIQLRGSAGKTIRQADFTERYNNYNKALVTSGSIGDPSLAAERSFSYEAGIDIFIKNSFKLSSGFFRRDQSKLIDWVTTAYANMPRKENLSPTGTYALATNIASVNTSGFETDIQFQRSFKKQQIIATAGVLWLDSKSSNGIQSFYISSHAKFLVNANLMYSNRFFAINVNGLYKSRNAQSAPAIQAYVSKDYFVCNVKAEGFLFAKKISLFMQANNLFNRQYSDLLGARMPGRWMMGGFRYQFSSN